MIALDATYRNRPNGENLKDIIDYIKKNNTLVMADISTYDEGYKAFEYGVDCISTTLSGYTPYSKLCEGPDYELIKKLVKNIQIPIIAEGKINTPIDLQKVYEKGAYSAVVGSAITRPQLITKRFIDVIRQ